MVFVKSARSNLKVLRIDIYFFEIRARNGRCRCHIMSLSRRSCSVKNKRCSIEDILYMVRDTWMVVWFLELESVLGRSKELRLEYSNIGSLLLESFCFSISHEAIAINGRLEKKKLLRSFVGAIPSSCSWMRIFTYTSRRDTLYRIKLDVSIYVRTNTENVPSCKSTRYGGSGFHPSVQSGYHICTQCTPWCS